MGKVVKLWEEFPTVCRGGVCKNINSLGGASQKSDDSARDFILDTVNLISGYKIWWAEKKRAAKIFKDFNSSNLWDFLIEAGRSEENWKPGNWQKQLNDYLKWIRADWDIFVKNSGGVLHEIRFEDNFQKVAIPHPQALGGDIFTSSNPVRGAMPVNIDNLESLVDYFHRQLNTLGKSANFDSRNIVVSFIGVLSELFIWKRVYCLAGTGGKKFVKDEKLGKSIESVTDIVEVGGSKIPLIRAFDTKFSGDNIFTKFGDYFLNRQPQRRNVFYLVLDPQFAIVDFGTAPANLLQKLGRLESEFLDLNSGGESTFRNNFDIESVGLRWSFAKLVLDELISKQGANFALI